MDLSHLKQKFIQEAEGLLTKLDNTLIELETNKTDMELINEAFRVMHTIKGASGMFGYREVVEITHELESLFDLVREGFIHVSSVLIETGFMAADHIRALLVDELCSDEANIQNHVVLKQSIEKLKLNSQLLSCAGETISGNDTGKPETWHILFNSDDDITKRAIDMRYTLHDLLILGEYKIDDHFLQVDDKQYWSIFLVTDKGYEKIEEALMFVMDYCKITRIADYNVFNNEEYEFQKIRFGTEKILNYGMSDKSQSVPDEADDFLFPLKVREITSTAVQKYKTSHVSVDAVKLDELMYLVSELVTSKSELLNALNTGNTEKAWIAGEKIEKLSRMFSENALNLHLVSIREMTEKFKRLIRDLAKQLNKKINFDVVGDDTELDKSIIDHISEPVMHLIRNCIDHGIELPELRRSRGKTETGTIKFQTVKKGNYVYISISDDGNGIDTDYVYRKAVEKGFITTGTVLNEKEIFDLIFLPGFSTAQTLSDVSGRGVGMDIVLKKLQEIRGEISIMSTKNQGTTFNLKLQQTISIINTLLVMSSGVTYAIPLDDIESCILEAHQDMLDHHNRLINIEGNLVPYLYIEKPDTDVNPAEEKSDKLVVLKKHEKVFALVVDDIVGEYQAVIKPIGHAFSQIKFLSGASLLGDGSIALLLDTEKLWYLVSEN